MLSSRAYAESIVNALLAGRCLGDGVSGLAFEIIEKEISSLVNVVNMNAAERAADNEELMILHDRLAKIAEMAGMTS